MVSTTFREGYSGVSIPVTANDLPPWSSDSETLVIVDGSGPLADRELRLCKRFIFAWKEEGWNHERTHRPFLGWCFFVFKNDLRLVAQSFRNNKKERINYDRHDQINFPRRVSKRV